MLRSGLLRSGLSCALALPRVTISWSHWLVLQLLDRLDDLLDVTRRDLHLLQGVLEHGEILGIKVCEVIDVLIACCLETIAMLCSSLRGPRKDRTGVGGSPSGGSPSAMEQERGIEGRTTAQFPLTRESARNHVKGQTREGIPNQMVLCRGRRRARAPCSRPDLLASPLRVASPCSGKSLDNLSVVLPFPTVWSGEALQLFRCPLRLMCVVYDPYYVMGCACSLVSSSFCVFAAHLSRTLRDARDQ